ncbi:MAG: response regulator [Gammaproteobacteria bacterium]|nr:response regulator [Gammaproteobacteria bacterium]
MSDMKRPVLIVDDEPRNVKILAAFLEMEGFEPIPAYGGEQALELAAKQIPEIILLDIMMPDLDGYEVTRRLKANPRTEKIPVILVTALSGADHCATGLDAGADEFLSKPVNRSELTARVRALCRISEMQRELELRQKIVRSLIGDQRNDSSKRPVILIVEDDERQARQISAVFEADGYAPIIASTAASARNFLAKERPALILLDLVLPDVDGFEFMDEIESDKQLREIPVIVLTALNDLDRRISSIERGAQDYMIKPVGNTELLARVRAGLRRTSSQQDLKRPVQQFQESSVTDGLTGVRNRQYLEADLKYRIEQARREPERPFSVVMVDIDHFKKFNEQYGHVVGDQILRSVAKCLCEKLRAADIVNRYGGDEFCIVLPQADTQKARAVAERLREAISKSRLEQLEGEELTVSIGLATFQPSDTGVEDLVGRCNAALYAAKNGGRNQVRADVQVDGSAEEAQA